MIYPYYYCRWSIVSITPNLVSFTHFRNIVINLLWYVVLYDQYNIMSHTVSDLIPNCSLIYSAGPVTECGH